MSSGYAAPHERLHTVSTEQPEIRVVRGNPTDEEVAALVAVLVAVRGTGGREPSTAPHRWASPAARLGSPAYGTRPGGWRASGLPR